MMGNMMAYVAESLAWAMTGAIGGGFIGCTVMHIMRRYGGIR